MPTSTHHDAPATETSPLLHHPTPTRPDKMSSATFWTIGAIYGAAAVGLGAFGAHGLKNRITDPKKLASWGTAAQYQLVHSVVLLIARDHPLAGVCFTLGITMFSGSIYGLTLLPEGDGLRKWLGPTTPLGGLCLIAGWLALAFGARPHVPRL
ncbi:DUF423-domain-containing protein [Podospora appendiculata]|uniref:DUF423-domain-containing protein n=1 Tax=Podospora appendiculata TaxID=314037 RepID=A0AAE0XDK8_9PEZI|nr:DUF423-domain-containing protein [Podospora appendiculata]